MTSELPLVDLRSSSLLEKGPLPGEDAGVLQQECGLAVTSIYLTKYEIAAILGRRACAPVMVDRRGEVDALRIARMELEQRRVPLLIKRELPGAVFEEMNPNELLM